MLRLLVVVQSSTLLHQLDEVSGAMSPSPNPFPVKSEGLPELFFPFPSLRGEGAGVRGKTKYLPVKGMGQGLGGMLTMLTY